MHQVGGLFSEATPPKYWKPKPAETDAISVVSLKKKRLDERGTPRFIRADIVTNHVAENIIAGKPYPVEVVIAHHSNFAFSAPGTERWWKAFEKVWLVNITTNISETALFADIVLPAATYLETCTISHRALHSGKFKSNNREKPCTKAYQQAVRIRAGEPIGTRCRRKAEPRLRRLH
jgi:anaerobic selenocysteine-containing dehydrogenase